MGRPSRFPLRALPPQAWSEKLFGPLLALELALVLVLGVLGEPFGGSGAVPEICIKLADFDTDLWVGSEGLLEVRQG